MATIIPFPSGGDRALESALTVTSDRLLRAGLSTEQCNEAIAELRDSLAPMFRTRSHPLELPHELELTQEQSDGVFKVVEEFFEAVKAEHAKDLAYAANVIAGLTARALLLNNKH